MQRKLILRSVDLLTRPFFAPIPLKWWPVCSPLNLLSFYCDFNKTKIISVGLYITILFYIFALQGEGVGEVRCTILNWFTYQNMNLIGWKIWITPYKLLCLRFLRWEDIELWGTPLLFADSRSSKYSVHFAGKYAISDIQLPLMPRICSGCVCLHTNAGNSIRVASHWTSTCT